MSSSTADKRATIPRTASIGSEASSTGVSNVASFTRAPASLLHHRASAEVAASPEDVASFIASAGSPEAAVQKALNEKNSAAAHNAQLWRLVEKQRAMIIDLNRNLEKSLKEKDRYRRKMRDHLISSGSAPSMSGVRLSDAFATDRERSQSPALGESAQAAHPVLRDTGNISRKVSESSDATSSGPRRSDTPQDAILSASTLPETPQSDNSSSRTEQSSGVTAPDSTADTSRTLQRPIDTTTTPPLSPKGDDDVSKTPQPVYEPQVPPNITAVSPPASASLAGFKNPTRKAPPAPLELSPRAIQPLISRALANESDSEYEDETDRERERITRGRRKTREDDDREREALVRQEQEARSKSMQEKSKSTSKSQPRADNSVQPEDFPVSRSIAASEAAKTSQYQDMSQPSALLKQRAVSDAAGLLPRTITAPSLLSPGLPMSPRPGDRPMNSPLPRAPNKAVGSIPMSPKAGMPLSPRPPKQPLPMPPQTPLTFASPHLARAEQYNQNVQLPSQVPRRPSSEVVSMSTGSMRISTAVDARGSLDVYRGLVTDQYPDLLLPPNALPSITVQVASSVLRRQRQGAVAISVQLSEEPVIVLGIYQRADNRQLWRIEKTIQSFAILDMQVKGFSHMNVKFPDKSLFIGAAPARVDARRFALNNYFEQMLDAIQDERTAKVFCKYISTDTVAAEVPDTPIVTEASPGVPASPVVGRVRREGYLTKKGKNFGGWKARYFVLDGPALKYFEAPGGAQLGLIKLQNAQIGKQAPNSKDSSEDEDNQFRHAFLILEPKKKDSSSLVRHVLCAESDDERDAWVDALLQYVDYREGSENPGAGTSMVNGIKSPRLQKTNAEIRPNSHHDAQQFRAAESMRYDQMIPGDAPMMGARTGTTPPPRYDESVQQNVQISGPSNAQLIQNTGEWGLKAPGTPGAPSKDKKRGLFSFRGRSSSDLAPENKGLPSDAHPIARAVFGVPLAEAISYAQPAGVHTELPAVVYRCIEYLEDKNASSEEGIFRLSGSNTIIKALRERFNTEGDVNLVGDGQYYDIHAVASLLKLFLRELPASILTRELHLDFLRCLELQEQDRTSALNVMVNRLPQPNRALLETLSAFLLSIVNNAEVNKMNVRNGKQSF